MAVLTFFKLYAFFSLNRKIKTQEDNFKTLYFYEPIFLILHKLTLTLFTYFHPLVEKEFKVYRLNSIFVFGNNTVIPEEDWETKIFVVF